MPSPATPGTNQFRCNACGRFFNSEADLREHEKHCRAAKRSSPAGADELAQEDAKPAGEHHGEH